VFLSPWLNKCVPASWTRGFYIVLFTGFHISYISYLTAGGLRWRSTWLMYFEALMNGIIKHVYMYDMVPSLSLSTPALHLIAYLDDFSLCICC